MTPSYQAAEKSSSLPYVEILGPYSPIGNTSDLLCLLSYLHHVDEIFEVLMYLPPTH